MAAGILLIGGLLAGGLWLAIGNGGASAVLADVGEFIEQAGTICFKMTIENPGNPPIEYDVQFLRPGLMRMEHPEAIMVMDWNTGDAMTLIPKAKQAHSGKIEGMDNPYHKDWLDDLKKLIASADASEAGTRKTDGRKLKGWTIQDGDWLTTVWADAKTAELVEVEYKQDPARWVMSNFEFGRELNEADFSLEPPADYAFRTYTEAHASEPSESDLIALLKVWANGNGNVFPDNLNAWEFHKAASKADWASFSDIFKDYSDASSTIGRGFMFLNMGPGWGYSGKGVKVGDATSAVFWYRPKKAEKYRVIYGDFSVKELTQAELPK